MSGLHASNGITLIDLLEDKMKDIKKMMMRDNRCSECGALLIGQNTCGNCGHEEDLDPGSDELIAFDFVADTWKGLGGVLFEESQAA